MSTPAIPQRPSYSKVLRDLLVRTRRLEAVPNRGHYQIKVFADDNTASGTLPETVKIVSAGNGQFIFAIPDDLAQSYLWDCFCYVTTAGSSVIRVQLRNVDPGDDPNSSGVDMLSTRMEIETGDYTSYSATTQKVINLSNNQLQRGSMIAIDVDDAGGGDAMGLGVGIELNPPAAA